MLELENYLDVMVDLETMSLRPNSRIIQIGACTFHRYTDRGGNKLKVVDTFEVNVVDRGGHICKDTKEFWKEQKANSPELEESLSDPKPISLVKALKEYVKFSKDAVHQWSNGSSFDCVILQERMLENKIKGGIPFYNYRDTRTMWDLFDSSNSIRNKAKNFVRGPAHNALVDAKRQTWALQRCFRKLERLI